MKKPLAVILVAFLLAPLTACGGGNTAEPADTQTADSTTVAQSTAPAMPVEKCDYKGAEFHIYSPEWMYKNCFAEEMNGEALNDAVYERTTKTEEYLNIDMTYEYQGNVMDMTDLIGAAVAAGDDAYQMVLTHFFHCVGAMATAGYMNDWKKMPAVNLDAEYWNQRCNDNLTVAGKQYYAVSDYIFADTTCTLFNQDIIKNNKLDDPYTLVREGKWTLDRMLTMADTAKKDLNGDGKMDVNDQWGISGEAGYRLNSLLYAGGCYLTTKNASGNLELTMYSDRTVNLMEKLNKLINGGNYFAWKLNAAEETTLRMYTGKVLFQFEDIMYLNLYRETEVNVGIVPYPKYDDSQETYDSLEVNGYMAVPTTVKEKEMVGKTVEMLSYFSRELTQPAYFNVLLGEKLARDKDSTEMLQLIFDSTVVDAGMCFFGSTSSMYKLYYTPYNHIYQTGNCDFASWYATYEKNAKAEIADLTAALAKLQ